MHWFFKLVVGLFLPGLAVALIPAPGAEVKLNVDGLRNVARNFIGFMNEQRSWIPDIRDTAWGVYYHAAMINYGTSIDPSKIVFETRNYDVVIFEIPELSANGYFQLYVEKVIGIHTNCAFGVSGSKVSLVFRFQNDDGKPKVELIDRLIEIGNMEVHCGNVIYDTIIKVVKNKILEVVNQKANTEIAIKLPKMLEKLQNFPMVKEFAGFFFDYSLYDSPTFNLFQMNVPILGQFYFNGHKDDVLQNVTISNPGFPSTIFPQLVCVSLNPDIIIKSGIQALNASQKLNFEFGNGPSWRKIFSFLDQRTNSKLLKFVSKLAPGIKTKTLLKDFANFNGKMNVGIDLTTNSSGILSTLTISGHVSNLTDQVVSITSDIGLFLEKLKFQDWKFFGELQVEQAKVGITTVYGTMMTKILEKIVQRQIFNVIKPIANEYFQGGLEITPMHLPVSFIKLKNTTINFNNGFIDACTDADFDFSMMKEMFQNMNFES